MLEELNGNSVLITGATTAIGEAVAKDFSRCGAEVGVHYYRSNEAAEQVAAAVRGEGGPAALLQGDVTDHADMARIIEAHIRTFGRPDVPISNAGDVGRRSPFGELSQRLIDCIIALSARSVVTACRLTVSGFITGATIHVNGGAHLS